MPQDNRDTTFQDPGFIWIPHDKTPVYKITITRLDGTTVDDITSFLTFIEWEDGVTDLIGRFEFEFWDPAETYKNAWTGMETIRIYADRASAATTLIFRGRIEKVSYPGNKIHVNGRSESLKFMDKTVTQTYTNQLCSDILKSLVTIYGSGFTTNNVETSTTSLTLNWSQKGFWDCVKDLCLAAGSDCYVDKNLDFNFFATGSRSNENEGIIQSYNLLEITDFATDVTMIKNKIKIYGSTNQGIQTIYTAQDTASQTAYGIRELIIQDNNITSNTQAQQYGDFYLERNKTAPIVGEVKAIFIPTIQPGERIYLAYPSASINFGLYDILSYKHRVDQSGYTTTVKVSKEPRTISHIFKSIIENINKLQDTSGNPFGMDYSQDFYYDSNSGVNLNTAIGNGFLYPTSATGTWTSDIYSLPITPTQVVIDLIGQTLNNVSVLVSFDGGTHYQTVSTGSKTAITFPGASLKFQVVFSSQSSQVDSLSVKYS